MAYYRVWSSRPSLRSLYSATKQAALRSTRHLSSGSDPASLLSKPSWSAKSLLPETANLAQSPTVLSKQLHHLLRLSALPPPSSAAEEEEMLKTLESQIHFVKEVQSIDTTNVSPLRSIRDETEEAQMENTIHRKDLEAALEQERYVGRAKRIQRTKAEKPAHPDGEAWDGDALKLASKTMGRFFVVQSSRDKR
ncbi:hypothetical protein FQN51_006561 [Onygenales sp. PD_10]|nr:hypothetical protein FQN51_006561 [Onygenales sp. PD_10]